MSISDRLWPVISRGSTGYSDTERAAIVAWKIDSTSVAQACLPVAASGVAPDPMLTEDEGHLSPMESRAAAPTHSTAIASDTEPAAQTQNQDAKPAAVASDAEPAADSFSVPHACPPSSASGVALGSKNMEDEGRLSSMESRAPTPLASIAVGSDAKPTATVALKMDRSSVAQACLPAATSGVAPDPQLTEDEGHLSPMESRAAAPTHSTAIASDTEPAAQTQNQDAKPAAVASDAEPAADSFSVPHACPPSSASGVALGSKNMEDEGRLSSMESRAAAPLASFEVGMSVRLHGLSREDLNGIVGVVLEDARVSARGRVAVELISSSLPPGTNPLAVKPENCTIVDDEEIEEVPALDDLDLLIQRNGQQNIIKVYPCAQNTAQLVVCFACNTRQQHRSRQKAAYYLRNLHFSTSGSPRKFH